MNLGGSAPRLALIPNVIDVRLILGGEKPPICGSLDDGGEASGHRAGGGGVGGCCHVGIMRPCLVSVNPPISDFRRFFRSSQNRSALSDPVPA